MGIKINISDSKISGNVLNNTSLKGNNDVNIELSKLDVDKEAALLNDLQIEAIIQELSKNTQIMDQKSEEYYEIEKLLENKNNDYNGLSKKIFRHIAQFSEGVLASIVANFLT